MCRPENFVQGYETLSRVFLPGHESFWKLVYRAVKYLVYQENIGAYLGQGALETFFFVPLFLYK